jgi:Dolichyl-phosphate-mannose-protein mannosyltransferase
VRLSGYTVHNVASPVPSRFSTAAVVRRLRWAVVLGALLICVAGALRNGMFKQSIWDLVGEHRFVTYGTLFAAAVLIFLFRRSALLPCFAAGALLYAAVLTGLQTVLALLYFTLACYGIGDAISRALRLDHRSGLPPWERDILSLVAGAGVWGFVVSLLAFTTWNLPAVHGLLLAVPAVAAGRSIAIRGYRALHSGRLGRPAAAEYWAMALLLFVLGAQFLMCLKPEVSADGIAVHLVVPMHVAAHHGWHFDVSQITWAVTPMTAEWCYTTLYLLGGEYAAKLLPFVFLAISCQLIVLLCRRLASRPASLLIAAVYAATPVVQLITGAMFVDMIWATFLLAALVLIVHWTERRDNAALRLGGILLGAAMATKFVALAFLAPSLAWVLFQWLPWKREAGRKSLSALLQAAALCAIIACPPYLTAWVKTGNPVFPYYNDVFRSPLYDTQPGWQDGRWQTKISWHAPLDMTFRSGKFLESQNGSLGLSWLFLIFLLLTAPRSMFARPVLAALLIGLCFFLLTWSRASYLRYLVPAFPPLLFGFAGYLRALRSEQSNLYRVVIGATVATILAGTYLLPSSGYWHKNFCLNPFEFKQEATEYVRQNAPARLLVQYLNRRAPGEPVAFFWIGIAGLKGRPYTSGTHTFEFYRQCERANSPEAVNELMYRNEIRYFVTPLPKCGTPNMPQLTQFIQRYTEEKYRSGCLYVAEVKGSTGKAARLKDEGGEFGRRSGLQSKSLKPPNADRPDHAPGRRLQ